MQDILASNREGAMEKLRSLIAGGVSVEHIIKDFSDYFRDLLLIREGVKNRNVLGVQISSFPQEILNAYTEEQLEAALDMFLNLYRNVRYSINPRFELELALSRLFRLKYTYSNVAVVQQLAKLKNDLINGTITPVEGPDVSIPKAPAKLAVPVQNITEQQQATEPEPEPVPVQEEKHWTEADLAAVVPQGVGNINMTENGLVLEFGSRLYYSAALQNREAVVAKIHSVTGDNINVIFSFSEKLDEERRRKAREEEQRRSEQEKLNSQKEDLFEDLMYAFDGKEVR
jgi:DNA polymerase-3 subunit gamma/tau